MAELDISNITEESLRRLSAAVMTRAAHDYRDDPSSRESIKRWIRNGNIWQDISLPDMSPEDIIRGYENYAK